MNRRGISLDKATLNPSFETKTQKNIRVKPQNCQLFLTFLSVWSMIPNQGLCLRLRRRPYFVFVFYWQDAATGIAKHRFTQIFLRQAVHLHVEEEFQNLIPGFRTN